VIVRAGAAAVDITPPLPIDLLGFVRRERAARAVWAPLEARACVFDSAECRVAIIAADLVGMTTAMADAVRARVAAAIDCPAEHVLLNSSHSHAAPWPGAPIKLGGEFDGWTDLELRYWETIPDRFASAAVQALSDARPAQVAGGVGRVPGLAVNRRERTPDGRTILGWNPDGFVDEEIPVIRVDAAAGLPRRPEPIATLVSFGCHPVVVGPEVPLVSPDYLGPLRRWLDRVRGGVTVVLQGAAGNVLPLEAFQDDPAAAIPFGERLALEAAHAVADADPRAMTIERLDYGSVTPISLYRRRIAPGQPEPTLAVRRRLVSLPLLPPPSVEDLERELAQRRAELDTKRAAGAPRAVTNPIAYHIAWLEHLLGQISAGPLPTALTGEIWAARIGDCAVVGAPGEIFSEIGHAVRAASPASVTLFAGYCGGVLGYVATPEEYPFGGYEPAVSHRGYGHPAPFSPVVAGIIRDTALGLLEELFSVGIGSAPGGSNADHATPEPRDDARS
jgi:hypothetical protein